MKAQKFPLYATVFMLLGVSILCALGMWQVKRLNWKTQILGSIEAEYNKPREELRQNPGIFSKPFDFKRVMLEGRFIPSYQFSLIPRTHEGQPGKHILTAFELDDGSVLFVNHGWAPMDWKIPESSLVSETMEIAGILRKPDAPNMFTPPNEPAKNIWYAIDFQGLKQYFGLKNLQPYILYLEKSVLLAQDGLPVTHSEKPQLNNNHLQYAFFWFTMAGLLVIIYVLRFWVERSE